MTKHTPNLAIHPSVREPGDGIWFATPAGYTPIPLDVLLAPPESAASESFRKAWDPFLLSAPDEVTRQHLIANLAAVQRMFLPMRREGTVHCSLGLHRDDTEGGDGSALISMFTVTWTNTSWAPRAVTAARSVVDNESHTNIEYAELPCGPASFSETVRTPTVESGLPQAPLLQCHAYLPHPDGTSLALLLLGTTAVAQRDQYRAILRTIAGTVSFADPFGPGATEEGPE